MAERQTLTNGPLARRTCGLTSPWLPSLGRASANRAVIRQAGSKGLAQIATDATQLAERARHGMLTPAEFAEGTFMVTNLGGVASAAIGLVQW